MNLMSKPPMGQKAPKAKPEPEYLDRVRTLPCVICDAFGMAQVSRTTAHHPIHGRYSARKAPDIAAIPLCDGHHQGNFDTTKVAVHHEPSKWKRLYGEDHEYTAITQDKLGI